MKIQRNQSFKIFLSLPVLFIRPHVGEIILSFLLAVREILTSASSFDNVDNGCRESSNRFLEGGIHVTNFT